MSVQRNVELIREILKYARQNKEHNNSHEQVIYELGYLIGLLANIANNDNQVYAELKRKLDRLQSKHGSK